MQYCLYMKKTALLNYIRNFLDTVERLSLRNGTFNGKPPIDWQAYRQDVLDEFQKKKSRIDG